MARRILVVPEKPLLQFMLVDGALVIFIHRGKPQAELLHLVEAEQLHQGGVTGDGVLALILGQTLVAALVRGGEHGAALLLEYSHT